MKFLTIAAIITVMLAAYTAKGQEIPESWKTHNKMIYHNDTIIEFVYVEENLRVHEIQDTTVNCVYWYNEEIHIFQQLYKYHYADIIKELCKHNIIKWQTDDSDSGDLYAIFYNNKVYDYCTKTEVLNWLKTGKFEYFDN